MTYQDDIRAAREKLAQAEEAMDDFIHGRKYDHELFKQLTDAVSTARNDLLDQLAKLWPKI